MNAFVGLLLAGTVAANPTINAAELADSVGVNVHIEYTDSGYRDLAHVMAGLQYLGVKSVRDAAPNPGNQGQGGYRALAQAGIRFNLFINGEEIGPAVKRVAELARQVPGGVLAVEGPNEINNSPWFTYGGIADRNQAGTAYQAALFEAVKANPTLSAAPVATFTDWPYTPGRSDLGNFHTYPKGCGNPDTAIRKDYDEAVRTAPDRPLISTEFGFPTFGGPEGVTERAQASLMLTGLLDMASLGVKKVYIYQLLDAYADPSGKDIEKHWGLFDVQYRPKLSAKVVRRFLSLLREEDRSAGAGSATPSIAITAPGEVRRLEIKKRSGEVMLALWREVKVCNTGGGGDLTVDPVMVDLRFSGPHGSATAHNLVAETRGDIDAGARSVRLPLAGEPLLIRVAPGPRI